MSLDQGLIEVADRRETLSECERLIEKDVSDEDILKRPILEIIALIYKDAGLEPGPSWPPTEPAMSAHAMLARSGNAPDVASANANMTANAQMNEKAVTTNASERREPHPPAKSDAPQRKTAITEQAAGATWTEEGTPVEQIADILGHQSVASTGVYLKSSLGLLSRCALDTDEPGRRAAQ